MVEMLIGLLIGSLLLAGAVGFFVHTRHSYAVQNALLEAQENGRFALEILGLDLRMADHWGGVEAAEVSGSPSVTGSGACTAAWILDARTALRGYDGNTSAPLDCLSNYLPASDVLVVRYAGTDQLGVAKDADGIYLRAAVGKRGVLLGGSDSPPADLPDGDGTYDLPFRISVFYLRTCSSPTACASGETDRPTLWRQTLCKDAAGLNCLVGNRLSAEPLVEGIEQIQFAYGVDTDNDGSANRFLAAASVADWAKVVAVQTAVISRGGEYDGGFSDLVTYSLAGGVVFVPSGDAVHFHRRPYRTVTQLRNRGRG